MGLHRTNSDESSIARRRMSGDTDAESISAMSDNKSVTTPGEEPTKTARRMFINDPIPESPRLPKDLEGASHDIGAVTDEPSVNPDKQTDEEQPSKNMLPADPTTAEVEVNSPQPAAGTAVANGKPKVEPSSAPSGSAKATGPAAARKSTTRPSAITTKAAAKPTSSTKSPAAVKTPTSANSTAAPKATAKATARPAAKATATSTRPTASTATKATASSATKKPATLKPSTSGTGFVKPKVKSPTKPVSLPPSLMAQTAASGAKGARQSLTAQTGNAPVRASSRAGATTGASKFPKAPVSKNSRPSIGPPPKKNDQQRPATRESNVDEGFLARMMRPTASSAQKTADKGPPTPPKRTAGRPSTTTSRRESSVRSSSRTKTPSVHASELADDAKDRSVVTSEDPVGAALEAPQEEADEEALETDPIEPSKDESQPASVDDAAEVIIESVAEPGVESQSDTVAETMTKPEAVDDVVLETAVVETAEEATEVAVEVDEVLSPAETEPQAPTASDEEPSATEEAAIEAANLDTSEKVAAVAEEAGLIDTPAEMEVNHQELSKEDEVAVDIANVETVEDATAIAAEADLVQTPVESTPHVKSEEDLQPSKTPEPADNDTIDTITDGESKQTSSVSSAEPDIDSLAKQLAETRIEAADEKLVDEEAKETR